MRTATGSYLLDAASAKFFRAVRFRVLQRDDTIVGRYGRHGSLRGSITKGQLRATWREADRYGWLALTFDNEFGTFGGVYGLGEPGSETAGFCSGAEVRAHRESAAQRRPPSAAGESGPES